MQPPARQPETSLEIRAVAASDTHALRSAVLRPGLPLDESVFAGDDDEHTLHVAALLDGRVVSVASIYHEGRGLDAPAGGAPRAVQHDAGTAWRLRGMATEPALRRIGAGAAALARCEQHASAHGGTLLWCNARIEAVAFYERAGWVVIGGRFEIPTAGPHVVMEKPLG